MFRLAGCAVVAPIGMALGSAQSSALEVPPILAKALREGAIDMIGYNASLDLWTIELRQ